MDEMESVHVAGGVCDARDIVTHKKGQFSGLWYEILPVHMAGSICDE